MPEEPYTWKRLTADQRVHTGPLVFRGVILAADAVGTADVTIYDGNDAGGRQFATFKTPTSRTETHGPSAPVLFDQGRPVGDAVLDEGPLNGLGVEGDDETVHGVPSRLQPGPLARGSGSHVWPAFQPP